MIWLAAGALVGLVALVVPLIAHLVARRPAARLIFPTLRFLDADPLAARTRRMLDEWPLLLLRLAIVAAAGVALAQPLLLTQARRDAASSRDVRVLVVDTSASMARRSAAAPTSIADEARSRAAVAASGAYQALVIESREVTEALQRAARWLAGAPPGRQRVTVFTDAQVGSLPAGALGALPEHVGVEVVALEPAPGERTAIGTRAVATGGVVVTERRFASLGTDGVLRVDREPIHDAAECIPPVTVVASHDEQAAADAVRDAVIRAGVPCAAAGSPPVRIALSPSDDDRPSPDNRPTPGMVRLAAGVLASLPALEAHRVTWGVRDNALEVRAALDPLDDAALRLVSAVFAAFDDRAASREADPRREAASVIEAWQRPAGEVPLGAFEREPSPDSRVVWGLVLVLLAIETWMRRQPSAARRPEGADAHAA